MDRAIRPRCQTQLTHAVLQTAFQRGLLLVAPVGDKEGARHPHLHGIEAAPARLDRIFENCDRPADILRGGILPEQHIVAFRGHLADRTLATGPHPDGRMRLLRCRGLDDDLLEGPIRAPMRERLAGGPRLDDHVDGLLEAGVGLLHRHTETCKLIVPVPLADTEIEPAPRQEIECCRLLRQQHGIVPRQYRYCRAQSQPARASAEPGQQVERGRYLTEAGEMVLDDEGAVEAERLGLDVVVDKIPEPFAAVELGAPASCRSATEETEFHDPPLYCCTASLDRRPTGGIHDSAALPDRARRPLPPKPRAHGFSHYQFHVASLESRQFLREHGHALPVGTRHAGDIGAPEATPWTEGVEYLLEVDVNVAIRIGLARIARRPGKFDRDIGILGECQQVAEIGKSGGILAAGSSTAAATVVDVELQSGMTGGNRSNLGHMAASQ